LLLLLPLVHLVHPRVAAAAADLVAAAAAAAAAVQVGRRAADEDFNMPEAASTAYL
jgi:hypothetical protein